MASDFLVCIRYVKEQGQWKYVLVCLNVSAYSNSASNVISVQHQYSQFCLQRILSLIFSILWRSFFNLLPLLHTFHLWSLSRLQGIPYTGWIVSPSIGLAAHCPSDLYTQNPHCDVRYRHGTEVKNIHDLECFHESTFFSASYFEYSLDETFEFSLQQ
jgi:hypothetical protein